MCLSQRPLILVGMPGSGKSYWAQRLAEAWGGRALDLDAEISRQRGQSIPGIFAESGEAGFRKMEQEILQNILLESGWDLLATGGGTPCFADNLEKLKAAGTVVYLDVPLPLLAERIRAQKGVRPLLAGPDEKVLLQKLQSLLAARLPYYQQAHHTLAAEGLTEATFALL